MNHDMSSMQGMTHNMEMNTAMTSPTQVKNGENVYGWANASTPAGLKSTSNIVIYSH